MQLSLNFLPSPQPTAPLDRLEPEQRTELIRALARIITKAASRAEEPMNTSAMTTTTTEGAHHD
jgi:hypothetical protein